MKTVLIVEDHDGVRDKMQQVLHRFGCATVAVPNGAAALEALTMSRVDLIVTDIIMPEMDGFAFLRRLGKNEQWANIPVIVLSAASDATAMALAAKLGVRAFLPKSSFSGDAFLSQVRQHLLHAGGRPALRMKGTPQPIHDPDRRPSDAAST